MRVAYVGKHGNVRRSNDDEGAITHAFLQLGHEVDLIPERRISVLGRRPSYDLLLFHHYATPGDLIRFPGPRVFWYFDLVDWMRDPSCWMRTYRRKRWMAQAVDVADVGFCTDGDWVSQDRTGKLVWLPQGYDERRLTLRPEPVQGVPPILFTGTTKGGGESREDWDRWMRETYGDRYWQVSGCYGKALHDVVAGVRVVVAPDAPVTDRYWSNRVYNCQGMGAFLLHPWAEGLSRQYTPTTELMYYNDREHLRYLIDWYLEDASGRQRVAAAALERTKKDHLYVNRVATMLSVLRQRGIVK